MNIVSQTVGKTSFSLDLTTREPCLIPILYGLLEHFFSSERGEYPQNDVQWFLELANNLQFQNTNVSDH